MKKFLLPLMMLATISQAASPIHITSKAQFDKILKDNSQVVVDFYADWCGPCKRFAPTFSQLANQFNNVVFVKVNTDQVSAVAKQFSVRSIPTIIFFKNGSQVARSTGSKNKNEFSKMLKTYFN